MDILRHFPTLQDFLATPTLSHETQKGQSDNDTTESINTKTPQTSPPPGSSTGDAQVSTYIGTPGDDYPASWGISVAVRKVPRV